MGMIFISHSSRNNGEAVAVRDWLVSNGWGPSQIFLDLDAFSSGDRWRARLDEIGSKCEAVIVCLSDEWIRSPECTREFTHAESRGKPIFPIIVAPLTEQIPRFVSDLQFVNISDPSVAETGFEKLKRGLKRAQIGPDHFAWPPASDPGRAPYRGLKAFEEEDAAIFFGRDAQITAGLDALRQLRGGAPHRILTIAAASGAGKSSFLKAGLLARLRRDEDNFLILPTWRPGRDALNGETGLLRSLGLSEPGTLVGTLASLQTAVIERVQAFGLADIGERRPPSLVLPLDQAEELFSADNSSAPAALNLLAEALAGKPDLLVVATIRSDSLGGLQADARIAGQLNLFNLPALPPSAFKEVIEGPAALARPPIRVEPALTERLIADLDRADALPLLAFTLERLVADFGSGNLLELREYLSGLGGVSGAINAAVEAAMRRAETDPALPDTRHDLDTLARAAFIPWLVQLDEADASPKRRVARLADIPDGSRALIQHFVDERLLVASSAGGETVIEVSHEAVLRHWRGLAAWISEERIVLERLQRVQRASQEWSSDIRALNRADMLVHRGERLKLAEELLKRADLTPLLISSGAAYLQECRKVENALIAEAEAQAAREIRQRRRARGWQAAAALILVAGFAALAVGCWFLVSEQREFGRSKSLMLARTSEQFLLNGDHVRAIQLAAIGSRNSALSPPAPEALRALESAASGMRQKFTVSATSAMISTSSDWKHVLVPKDNTLTKIDLDSGVETQNFIRAQGRIRFAAFSPDDTRIFISSDDSTASIWNATSGERIWMSSKQITDLTVGQLYPGRTGVAAWSGNTAWVWHLTTGAQIGQTLTLKEKITSVAYSPNGTRLATKTSSGELQLWDIDSGAEISTASFTTVEGVREFYFFGDDRLAVLGTETVSFVDAKTGELIGANLVRGPLDEALYFSQFLFESGLIIQSNMFGVRIFDANAGRQLGPEYLTFDPSEFDDRWSGKAESQSEAAVIIPHNTEASAVQISSDGKRLFIGTEKSGSLWDVDSAEQIGSEIQSGGKISGATFSNDNTLLAIWSGTSVSFWDTTTAGRVGKPISHDTNVTAAQFDPSGSFLWTMAGENAQLWEVSSRLPVSPPLKHDGNDLTWGGLITETNDFWTATSIGSFHIWDLFTIRQTGNSIQLPTYGDGGSFSSDGELVVAEERGGRWKRWSTETALPFELTPEPINPVRRVLFVQGGNFLALHNDGSVVLRDTKDGKAKGTDISFAQVEEWEAFDRSQLSADGQRLLAGDKDGNLRLWNLTTGESQPIRSEEDYEAEGLLSANGDVALLAGSNSKAQLFNLQTNTPAGPMFQLNDRTEVLGWSPNLTYLITVGDGKPNVWSTRTGSPVEESIDIPEGADGAAFSKDESHVVIFADSAAQVWSLETGSPVGQKLQHDGYIKGAVFSDDASRVLTWSADQSAKLWDTVTGTMLGNTLRHDSVVDEAMFSPDEKRLLTWTDSSLARIWDVSEVMPKKAPSEDPGAPCSTKLRGSLTVARDGSDVAYPRLLDAKTIAAAPILRGREGEDVCAVPKRPWWDAPLQWVVNLTGME